MLNWLFRRVRKIGLFYAEIDKDLFANEKKGSCIIKVHPCINKLSTQDQDKVRALLDEATDIIRDNIEVQDL